MEGEAEARPVGAAFGAQRIQQRKEAVDIVQEGPLARRGRRAAEAGMGVEDGQMGQADARPAGRRQDAARAFQGGMATLSEPMEIMELGDLRKAPL